MGRGFEPRQAIGMREGFGFHFPLMTSLLISLTLSLLLGWWRNRRTAAGAW